MTTTRHDGRRLDELRAVSFVRDFTTMAMGSTLVSFGETRVLCTASVADEVPRWMRGKGEGWVTAEYSMLPGSSPERVRRPRNGPNGRSQEIQRLIGRSLRAVTDLELLGEVTMIRGSKWRGVSLSPPAYGRKTRERLNGAVDE